MKFEGYWEEEEFKNAIDDYSKYLQMCKGLDERNQENQWAFVKRDEYAHKVNAIRSKYLKSMN